MKRTIIGLTAALALLFGGVVAAQAAPAAAPSESRGPKVEFITSSFGTATTLADALACPTNLVEDVWAWFPDGHSVVGTFIYLDCRSHFRIKAAQAGTGSSQGVEGWERSPTYGNPAMTVFSGGTNGTIVAQYIATYIPVDTFVSWPTNPLCNVPCVARIKGQARKVGTNYGFQIHKELTTTPSAES